jgi:hypothetical protein
MVVGADVGGWVGPTCLIGVVVSVENLVIDSSIVGAQPVINIEIKILTRRIKNLLYCIVFSEISSDR